MKQAFTFTSEIDIKPVQHMGGDHMVLAAARVSTSGEEAKKLLSAENREGLRGTIRYLMKHKHGTPFEHSSITFFAKAPIFVYREWHRHRIGQSYNEESGRYSKLQPVFYIPDQGRPMFKADPDNWKPSKPKFITMDEEWERLQKSNEILSLSNDPKVRYDNLVTNLKESYELAYCRYEENLEMGFDPGIARACLPVGIFSSMWVTLNPRSIMSFLSLRTHNAEAMAKLEELNDYMTLDEFIPGASRTSVFLGDYKRCLEQSCSFPLWEIEVAAKKIEEIFQMLWPITYEAYQDFGRIAP